MSLHATSGYAAPVYRAGCCTGGAVSVTISLSLVATFMAFCVDALSDISLHDTVEHKFGELTQKVLAARLHQGIAECHVVVSHRLTLF